MVDPTGELYFRVNDATRGQYEDAGASKDRGMPYWDVSRETIEDGDALLALAREALDVALAVKKKR
jgi:TfoX/Sxy family transcriptional regulator of competence genes